MVAYGWCLLWLALIALLSVNVSGATYKQRCYICIPNNGLSIQDVLKLYPSGPEIPLCNKFTPGRREYFRECPSHDDIYMGCMTATNGTHITKSCTTVAVNDCETANNVTYCYCTGDLCNAENVPVEEARPAVNTVTEATQRSDPDDEDGLAEGSGYSQESSETSGTLSRLPTTHDDVTVEETDKTSVSPEKETSKLPGNAAFTIFANMLMLFVSLFVQIF